MHVFLTDFGLAKNVRDGALTRTGAILGTLDYAAPEQLQEASVDARTDVYALGCLLFHALTGRVPYPRTTDAAKILAHVSAPPPSLADFGPHVPEALARVVARAMCTEPDGRYATAAELASGGGRGRRGGRAASASIEHGGDRGRRAGRAACGPPAGPAADAGFPAALAREGRAGPFVGRAAIIDRLARRYALVTQSEPQFVTLCGEPGVGKTRLAGEFARMRLRRRRDGPLRPLGRRVDRALPALHRPPSSTTSRTTDSAALAEQLDLELGELGRLIPGLHRTVPDAARAGAARARRCGAIACSTR